MFTAPLLSHLAPVLFNSIIWLGHCPSASNFATFYWTATAQKWVRQSKNSAKIGQLGRKNNNRKLKQLNSVLSFENNTIRGRGILVGTHQQQVRGQIRGIVGCTYKYRQLVSEIQYFPATTIVVPSPPCITCEYPQIYNREKVPKAINKSI